MLPFCSHGRGNARRRICGGLAHHCALRLRQARGHEVHYTRELDLETLVWTRGPSFPLASLDGRLMCPRCRSRRSGSVSTADDVELNDRIKSTGPVELSRLPDIAPVSHMKLAMYGPGPPPKTPKNRGRSQAMQVIARRRHVQGAGRTKCLCVNANPLFSFGRSRNARRSLTKQPVPSRSCVDRNRMPPVANV